MTLAEDEARSRDLQILTLYTNEAIVESIAMYLHLGYVEVERREENGYRRVFMKKVLMPVKD